MVLQQGDGVVAVVGHMAIKKVVVALVARHVFQIDQLRAAHLAKQLLVVEQGDAHFGRDLAFDRGAAELLFELVDGSFNRALLTACAAAHPVAAAQLVEHGAADALGGEGFKLHALADVETRERVGQADQPDLDQVVDLDIGGQLGDHLVRQPTHERAVLLDERRVVEATFGGVHAFYSSKTSSDDCVGRRAAAQGRSCHGTNRWPQGMGVHTRLQRCTGWCGHQQFSGQVAHFGGDR